jgi:hypothetical protein
MRVADLVVAACRADTAGDPRLRAHVAAHRDGWLADVPGEPLPEDLRAALARYPS